MARGILALVVGLATAALLPAASSATSPGANGLIVWQSQTGTSGGLNEIWVMNANGTGKDALTDNAFNDERPGISADATKVTFMAYRIGDGDVDSWEIYKMNINGTGQTALTDDDDTDFEPAWSADGTKVIFQRTTTGLPAGEVAGQDLWTVTANGATETNLTNTPNAYECCAESSPDGTKIAFTNSGDTDGNPMTDPDTNEIWVMNANGTGQTQLTFGTGTDQNLQPTWSPDGDQIAYLHTTPSSQDIWIMDADGENDAPITASPASEYSPVWSPDGDLLAFEQPGGDGEIVTSGITLSPPGLFTPLTNNSVNDQYPSWAPASEGGAAPNTKITSKPGDVIHKPKATYKFKAIPAAGASFKCKLDAKPYKRCSSPKRYRNLDDGKHKFKVRATGPGGTDSSPARDGFKVKP